MCGVVCGKSCGTCPDDGVCSSDGSACTPAREIGASCDADSSCGLGRLCLTGATVPGGYCTRRCSVSNPCPEGSLCGAGPTGENVCLKGCSSAAECRPGEGFVCTLESTCSACVGRCDGRSCGDDGCGNSCGLCEAPGGTCSSGRCGDAYTLVATMLDGSGRADPRFDATALVNGLGQLFVIGGRRVVYDPNGAVSTVGVATVTRYDNGSFKTFAPLPEPIARPHAAILNDEIYIAGGIVDADPAGEPDGVVRAMYRQNGSSWLKLNQSPPPHPAPGGGLEALGGKLHLIVGGERTSPSRLMEIYDPVTDTWSAGPERPSARTFFATATDGDRLYVMGGFDGTSASPAVELFDPSSGWSRTADLPVPVVNAKAVVADGRIFLFGGVDADGVPRPVVQVIELSTRRTSVIGTTFGSLFFQAPVRTRSGEVLLFGGTRFDGGVFGPHDEVLNFSVPLR